MLNLIQKSNERVAADRMFRSMVRTCRLAGVKLPQALHRANEVTLNETGFNLMQDYQIETATIDQNKKNKGNHLTFFEQWQLGKLPVPFVAAIGKDLYEAYKLWCCDNQQQFMPINKVNFAAVEMGTCKRIKRRLTFNQHKFSRILIPNTLSFLNLDKNEIEKQLLQFKKAIENWEAENKKPTNLVKLFD